MESQACHCSLTFEDSCTRNMAELDSNWSGLRTFPEEHCIIKMSASRSEVYRLRCSLFRAKDVLVKCKFTYELRRGCYGRWSWSCRERVQNHLRRAHEACDSLVVPSEIIWSRGGFLSFCEGYPGLSRKLRENKQPRLRLATENAMRSRDPP
jgi:hypothetical protein